MRRNYISPEFQYDQVYGTFKMSEDSAFFGSKMLEIEDSIDILSDNLVYNQLSTNEQIDESTEKNLPEIVYDATVDKGVNHKIELDLNQTDAQKKTQAKWILTIELKTIINNYIFATLKKYRTFEGVRNSIVLSNNVDIAIYDYINRNVYSRYKLLRVEFFILPVDLCGDGTLQYSNEFDQFIESDANKITDFQTQTSSDGSEIRLLFAQKKNAEEFSFKYYFNLYFEKL
jgi:hypothetical protein